MASHADQDRKVWMTTQLLLHDILSLEMIFSKVEDILFSKFECFSSLVIIV